MGSVGWFMAININYITTRELRTKTNQEGLILQGCGGDPQEWLDGINGIFTREGLLLDGTGFRECSVFDYDGYTCILFPFDDNVKLNMGKLAMWRLLTHESFGGTWLSDFVPNRLGGYLSPQEPSRQKPDCPLIGQDGNIFNLMGVASKTLRENGMQEQATEMSQRIKECGSYYEALGVIGEYVNITSVDEDMQSEESKDICHSM